MNLTKKTLTSWLLIFNIFLGSAFADVITTSDGTKVEVGDGKTYGPSYGYNPNSTKKEIQNRATARKKELGKAAKKLKEDYKNAANQNDKDRIAKELDRISKEIRKNQKESQFEDKLSEDDDLPRTEPHRGRWKREQRRKRLEEEKAKQKALEEEEQRMRQNARSPGDLRSLGHYTVQNSSESHSDVLDSLNNQADAQDEFQAEGCLEINDSNIEVCSELREVVVEVSATAEEQKSRFQSIVGKIPSLILAGGGIFSLYKSLSKIQKLYKAFLDKKREAKFCNENCGQAMRELISAKEELEREQLVQEKPLQLAQDEHNASEIQGDVDVELIIPPYLTENTETPFANLGALPLVFGVESDRNIKDFKNIKVLVNGKNMNADYYPEYGVIKTQYVGFEKKEDFSGAVILEAINGQKFVQKFKGKINTNKPVVDIRKKDGGTFSKTRFKVKVRGDFDQIEVTGVNIKTQIMKFDSVQKEQDFTVKTLSRGAATINIKASLKTKIATIPNLDGVQFETNSLGRILNTDSDFFPTLETSISGKKKKELGFCCESMNSLTCEGCYAGKRSRASCKALNKLPGFKITAFLRASDLKCTSL